MSNTIHEDNYKSKARASPRGGVCRKPATARRGEEPERQSRLTSLGRAGTTQRSPVHQGSGYMPRLCSDCSRSYPGRAAPCPGQWRATAIDCGEESSALSAAQQSAEVRVARCPGGPSEGPNRTDKAEGGPPRQSQT